MSKLENLHVCVFQTPLGWLAFTGRNYALCDLTFGHKTADAAQRRIDTVSATRVREADWHPTLRKRLQDYAEGAPVDFLDIDVECETETRFTLAVLEVCRRIPFGETLSYGELADRVGAPRAGRAVGNVMRTNRRPLVIPCHRVVHSDGRIGQFSAPQGASMKERLLAMEAASGLVTLR